MPENAEEEGHVKEITVTAFSPDGRHLATAALDGYVHMRSNSKEARFLRQQCLVVMYIGSKCVACLPFRAIVTPD